MTKTKKSTKSVRAWCIIDRETTEIQYSGSIVLVDRFHTKAKGLNKGYLSVPCTITYTLPTKE